MGGGEGVLEARRGRGVGKDSGDELARLCQCSDVSLVFVWSTLWGGVRATLDLFSFFLFFFFFSFFFS